MKVYGAQPGIIADLKLGRFWFGNYFVSYVRVSDMRYGVQHEFMADYE